MAQLSTAEKYVWDVIQEHYAEIPQTSISKLSEMAHASISTINRTVKKKGYDGYAAFRYSVKETESPQDRGFSREILAAISKNEEELWRTINSITVEDLEAAVDAIKEAKDILLFARGLSVGVATEMMKKLQLYHKSSAIYDDNGSMTYFAKQVTAKSLIIVFSLSGERAEVNYPVAEAKKLGATILALTVSENSTLSKLADISLVGYKSSYEVFPFDLDVHSRLPLYIMNRILFDVYSIQQNKDTDESES